MSNPTESYAVTQTFWQNTPRSMFTCPDAAFFRFVSHLGCELKGKNVLDLGFGQGHDLLEVCRRGGCGFGIDIDPRVVELLGGIQAEYPKVKTRSIQAVCEGFPGVSFDLVYCLNAIYYLTEQELDQTLAEVMGVLRPGGFFVFQALVGDYDNQVSPPVLDNSIILKDASNPIIFRDREFYTDLLKRSGFEICGVKSLTESFSVNEEALRTSLYLAGKKV